MQCLKVFPKKLTLTAFLLKCYNKVVTGVANEIY